jgi:hypothetical protein
MNGQQLSKQGKLSIAITPTNGAAGTADINGDILDMQGFESVLVAVTFGAITSTAVTSIKAQQGAASNMSDAADLEGTAQVIADTDDDKTFYIEITRPRERYVRLVVDRGTANAVVASALYIQHGAAKQPVSHGTNVAGESHISPAEGTA